MSRRVAVALAAVRPTGVPRLPAPPSFGRPSRRALARAGAVALACVAAYAAARGTSLFAVQTIELAGAPPAIAAEAREALRPLEGESLVALDPDDVERRLRAVPSVRAAEVDRAFPHTLAVSVEPERPLAVVRQGGEAWLVAETGRVVAEVRPHARPALARIRVRLTRTPSPGETLADPAAGAGLEALRAVPRRFPLRVLFARVEEDGVTLVLQGWLELRLGEPIDLRAKLLAGRAVIRTLTPEERAGIAYLDVTEPERVVARDKSQPESETLGLPAEVPAN
jgi:cell division septal protein FtsQ